MLKYILLAVLLLCLSCRKVDQPSIYRYEVISEAESLHVEFQDEYDNTISMEYVESGWQHSWVQVGPRYLSFKAKNNTLKDCAIIVRIWCDNRIIAQTTRDGPLNVAYVSGVF
jgi:hypothetical protein